MTTLSLQERVTRQLATYETMLDKADEGKLYLTKSAYNAYATVANDFWSILIKDGSISDIHSGLLTIKKEIRNV